MERLSWCLLRGLLSLLGDEHAAISLLRFFGKRTAASRFHVSYLERMFWMGVPDGRNGLPLLGRSMEVPLSVCLLPLGLAGLGLSLPRHVVLEIDDLGVPLALWARLAILAEGDLALLAHLLQCGEGFE
jgi:hypothetical protein